MTQRPESPSILALARSDAYTFSKTPQSSLRLLEGLGVEGDIHCGETVKHRSRVAVDPNQPNLRQVHLIQGELFAELRELGFDVEPAALGENVTTFGIDLLGLAAGTLLALGEDARIEVTGLRNPCGQINGLHKGLLDAVRIQVRDGDKADEVIRRAGVMAVVRAGGIISIGDPIVVVRSPEPHQPLECV